MTFQGVWSFLLFLDTFCIQRILSFLLFLDTFGKGWKVNKLETFEDALWKLQNFNTQNWKPCTLDLSPCGKRNAVKSRLGHLWIVFYKWYPPLFALSHPFKPLVDYRLLCSQYNTGRTSYSGTSLLLALKIAFFLSLKSITLSLLLILTTIRYMMETGQRLLYIAMFVMENGRGWMAVKRQPFAGFVNNQNTLCECSWSNDFVSKVISGFRQKWRKTFQIDLKWWTFEIDLKSDILNIF